jgi:GrxB family glutaredoxin
MNATKESSSVIAAGIPELYVYDHCPFCVRVRMALGVKGIQHKLVFMGNDDIETPTALVGKKIAPVWVDKDGPMMESLDIIKKIDPEGFFAPASDRTDLKAWQKSVQTVMRQLARPRYVKMLLPEFMQKAGRDAFVNNHQMPPFEKADWKGNPDMSLETKYEKYEEAFNASDALVAELNGKLKELDGMIHCADYCTEGIGLSYDDIDLWARLRSLTAIKGLVYPPKLRAYLDHFEEKGDCPLYDLMAI